MNALMGLIVLLLFTLTNCAQGFKVTHDIIGVYGESVTLLFTIEHKKAFMLTYGALLQDNVKKTNPLLAAEVKIWDSQGFVRPMFFQQTCDATYENSPWFGGCNSARVHAGTSIIRMTFSTLQLEMLRESFAWMLIVIRNEDTNEYEPFDVKLRRDAVPLQYK